MKIIFMGTPDFAVPTLEALISAGHEITAVYTKPDEEQGRGKKIRFSPVKEAALSHNIPVYQPKSLKKAEQVEILRNIEADVIIVVAYGLILRKNVLEMKKYGCINVHASLLPSYRGAAPIQWAVINGEEKSGVTIMQMNEGLDTGDILSVREIPLDSKETGDSLFEKLSRLGGPLLLETLEKLEKGEITPVPQGETDTMYAKMLTKEMGNLSFTEDAVTLERLIRGLNSWPSAYTRLDGKLLKIWEAEVVKGKENVAPGTVVEVTKRDFTIQCGSGALKVLSLQPEGKKRMDTDAFLRGNAVTEGTVLG